MKNVHVKNGVKGDVKLMQGLQVGHRLMKGCVTVTLWPWLM